VSKKFRAVIQFNLDIVLDGESADNIARELHKGMVDILASMGANMEGDDPGSMLMQGRVDPVDDKPANNGTGRDRYPN
jgi:hypothetical protein